MAVSDSVRQALHNGDPVVALESTIVAHGMPYPQNLEVAQSVESILSDKGVTPATIAVVNGQGKVGLSSEELQSLAKAGSAARKCTTRELSLLMMNKAKKGRNEHDTENAMNPSSSSSSSSSLLSAETPFFGATTVASTMALAHAASIPTFVTGGIGGVHRNGHVSMDVSADLNELSRTPVIVVSAGIKSILDIGRTLEVLETLGVPVVTYQSNDFPAFFSPTSGFPTPWRVDTAEEVAAAYQAGRQLGLSHGMLVAVPNNDPAGEMVERAIQEALVEADRRGIQGNAVTPFLLKTIAEQTDGESLRSNIGLVQNNANVGADIAIEIAAQRSSTTVGTTPHSVTFHNSSTTSNDNSTKSSAESVSSSPTLPSSHPPRVIVLGGAVVDMVARPQADLVIATSNPGSCAESDGGVGRNVAEALGRLGCNPILYSAVGDDARGKGLLDRLVATGCQNASVTLPGTSTATYLAVLNHDYDLHVAIADTDVLSEIPLPPRHVFAQEDTKVLVMDANVPLPTLKQAALMAAENSMKICLEPTSVPKARIVAKDSALLELISYAFPNVDELLIMAEKLSDRPELTVHDLAAINHLPHIQVAATMVLKQMHPDEAHLIITMGEKGVMLASKNQAGSVQLQHFPAPYGVEVKNATGAGDSLCAAFVAALLNGKSVTEAVAFGMQAATLTIQCKDKAVSTKLDQLRNSLG